MAAKQPIWGIDVGQCSLKAIKLQAISADEFELLAFDLIEHPEILSQSETDATDLVAESIAKFAERNDTSRSKLVIAVPGQQTLTKFTKMPPVEKKKIPHMVQYEASQQIPFDMDEVVWDYQIFGESEGTTEIEVGIFAIRKELIRNYLMLYTESGLEPNMVQTSPIASYNTARFELPMPEGEAAVLLDMGAVATDLIIIDGERIWSRPVPIGGNKFTEALVSAFKIAFKKAEKLKRNAAASKHAKQIFQAMRPVFADLVSEVQRSIGFYTSTHRDTNITKVIGMGNAFKLPGLQKFLQQNLQMEVTKLSGFKHLRPAQVEKKDEFNENIMSMAVCYGLALQGMELAKVESNLLPIEFRRHMLWQKKRPWFAGAAAMLALGAGSIWASNLSASGTIAGALGDNQAEVPRPKAFTSDVAAESALQGARNLTQPLEKAAIVVGAATQLKNSYSKADEKSKNAGTINLLAKYPENNVFVPRILSVIHEAVGEVTAPEIRTVQDGEGYQALARRIPRTDRKEVWIQTLYMGFSDTPETLLGGETNRTKPGWAIRISGVTPLDKPARWIEDDLMKNIERLGRRPDRGFYVDDVRLIGKMPSRTTTDVASGGALSESVSGAGASGRGGMRGGSGVSVGSGGGGGPGFGRGRPAAGGRGGDGNTPRIGGGNETPDKAAAERAKQIEAELEKLDQTDIDQLTGESVTTDSVFTLEIIVRKADTPKDMIPESFKEATPDKDAETTSKKP
ncbi:MAG: type IV pilus assembly protein PilM [Phycisphaerales bacterium]|nr:type IV pilus assembly protein PilM [Phycisphaerales bacterium]MCB9857128.1 type IV pilus assembly protein PilM [Phycisphaerales bacterium]MCB9861745.1 type IV pilus assembly protein PilM [Phycisphaerales bacterium]